MVSLINLLTVLNAFFDLFGKSSLWLRSWRYSFTSTPFKYVGTFSFCTFHVQKQYLCVMRWWTKSYFFPCRCQTIPKSFAEMRFPSVSLSFSPTLPPSYPGLYKSSSNLQRSSSFIFPAWLSCPRPWTFPYTPPNLFLHFTKQAHLLARNSQNLSLTENHTSMEWEWTLWVRGFLWLLPTVTFLYILFCIIS